MNWIRTSGNFNVSESTKFATIGGSYPGALSAWFREKFPYLTVGALASSAVVNSFIDYPSYDQQVYTSLMKSGPQCVASVQLLNNYIEAQIANNSAILKASFNSEKLTNDEFLFAWADTIATFVQYGKRTDLCNMLAFYGTLEDQFEALRQYFLNNTDPAEYGSYYLSQVQFSPDNAGSRQWTWQICSELGWFQTAPENTTTSLRSSRLDLNFYKQWCQDSFGFDLWPVEGLANLYRGGTSIEATNLIMTNGCEDPWQWASMTHSNYSGILAYYIDCNDCGHCVELYTPTPDDAWTLLVAREKIKGHFADWLGDSFLF